MDRPAENPGMPTQKSKNNTNEKKTRRKSGSSHGSLTFLVLVLVILVLIVGILALKEPLTHLVIKDKKSAQQTTSSPPPETSVAPLPEKTVFVSPSPEPTDSAEPSPRPGVAEKTKAPAKNDTLVVDGGKKAPATPAPSKTPGKTKKTIPAELTPKPSASPAKTQEPKKDLKTAVLFMARMNESGDLQLQSIKRKIDFGDSPLQNSISALLKGPSAAEINQGMISMIPQGTRLISAWVSNGTAFLNFNENFMFNPLGSAGLNMQLKQVVYAACEFPTIQRVQILIEGKKTDYLGGDNVFVGDALTPKSLD